MYRWDHAESHPYRVRRTLRGGRTVVVKTARDPSDTQATSLLRHEHELLRRLSIPGVARAVGFEEAEDARPDAPQLILEDAGSSDLATLLAGGPLDPDVFLDFAIEMTSILAGVHRANVLHRNLSPASFVIGTGNGTRHITLVGFDAATETMTNAPARTGAMTAYIAPELTGRLGRRPDQRADLYSLGAVLYDMLIGRPPFTQDDPLELAHAHLAKVPIGPATLDARIPRALSDIILKLLAKAPEDRYQSAEGLLFDLREARRQWRQSRTIAPFELGREELVRELVLPSGLYGRDRAFADAMQAIARRDEGTTSLLVVTGPGGIGKSSLVGAVAERAREHGRFLSGKCDVLATNRPYAWVLEVFGQFVTEWANAPEQERADVRTRLREATAPSTAVLTEFDPRLVDLLGETAPAPALGDPEAEARLLTLLQSFFRVLATERPLTLFLDDAQWADEASLKLVRVLTQDPDLRSLLLCIAYRTDEVGVDHTIRRTIEAAKAAGVPVNQIELGALNTTSVSAFLADALNVSQDAVTSLAFEVDRKTAGNPLFLRRLLTALHRSDLLVYDRGARSWSWDVAKIAQAPIADDVVELLLSSIEQLPRATQDALAVAACFGAGFELGPVAAATDTAVDETAQALLPAVHDGLVVAMPRGPASRREGFGYRFAHDRIQQAAYTLRSPEERQQLHLRVGRMLLASADPSMIFTVADQLNLASPLLGSPGERLELAELNLRAGELAQKQSAHGPALAYLSRGLSLLPEDAWTEHHTTAFRLHLGAASSAGMVGELARATAIIEAALPRVATPDERAELYVIGIMGTTIAGRFADAIRALEEALPSFGLERPKGDLGVAAASEMALAQEGLAQRGAELLEAPPMESTHLLVLRLLVSALPASFYVDPRLQAWLTARVVNFALAHGPAPPACFAITLLSMALAGARHYRVADDVGRLSIRLADRLGSPAAAMRASFLHASLVRPWVEPIRTCIPLMQRPVDTLLKLGEHQHAPWYVELLAALQLAQGVELETVLATVEVGAHLTRRLGHSLCGSSFELFGSGVRELTGGTSDAPPRLEAASPVYACVYRVLQTKTAFILGDLATATAMAARAKELLPFLGGLPGSLPEYHLYAALTEAAVAERASPEEKASAILGIRAHREEFELWAGFCPENFRHTCRLLDAEIARLEGRPLDAIVAYEAAIELAERDGFVHHAAITLERCGRLWSDLGSHRLAETSLKAAMRGYARWGATAKVQAMMREFPSFASEVRTAAPAAGDVDLDVLGLLTAAETLASEVDLARLVDQLMRTCLETAGAERGLLILEEEQGAYVRASAAAGNVTITHAPLDGFPTVPHTLVADVRRSGRSIVLDDARRGNYAHDSDVVERKVRSVLSMPIRRADHAVGVLYLENNLLVDAFPPERVRALDLLSGHLAVALENSLLFEARRKAEAALRFLADASATLAESLDYETTLSRVAHIGVPSIADMAAIHLVSAAGIQRVAVAHVDPTKEALLASADVTLDVDSAHPVAVVIRTGHPWVLANIEAPPEGVSGETAAVGTRLGVASALIVPLRARGRTLGTLALLSERPGAFSTRELTLAEEVGRRAGLAIDNARLYEETLEMIRKRDEFLALASHELRTPLTSLQLAIQPLSDENVQRSHEITARVAKIATRQVTRLGRLVNELLDVSQLQFGKLELVLEDVGLDEIVRVAAERLGEDLTRAHCTLSTQMIAVNGYWDRSALERVVTNLLANALKFGAGAPIEVTVDEDDGRARLVVTDHGIGIPPDRIKGLFERFERVVSSRYYGGFGLGLYISRLIVEGLGGTIRAQSDGAGTGATFTVLLPRSQEKIASSVSPAVSSRVAESEG